MMILQYVTREEALRSLLPNGGWYLKDNEPIYLPDAEYNYTISEVDEEVARLQPQRDIDYAWQQFKEQRINSVAVLTVTVNGKVFDADEVSQNRMLHAITVAKRLNSPTIPFWKLTDNTVYSDIPVTELEDVHTAAVIAMAQIWLQ